MKTDSLDNPDAANEDLPPRAPSVPHATLRESVSRSLRQYLRQVEGESISDLYQMVLAEVEVPLLEAVMEATRSNQTRASSMLGLNRGTLRKKLKQYGML